jgi:hypothetical protein
MTTPSDAITRLGQYNTSVSNVPYTFVGPTAYGYSTTLPMALTDVSTVAGWIAEVSETLVISPDGTVTTFLVLTQGEYDAIAVKDDSTIYIITG